MRIKYKCKVPYKYKHIKCKANVNTNVNVNPNYKYKYKYKWIRTNINMDMDTSQIKWLWRMCSCACLEGPPLTISTLLPQALQLHFNFMNWTQMPLGVAEHKSPIANASRVREARRRRRQLFGRSVTRGGCKAGWAGDLGWGDPNHMP